MWRIKISRAALCLFSILVVLSSGGVAQDTAPIQPPQWSVGEWWVAECQVYDLGKTKSHSTPDWRPSQPWRFQVEKIDSIGDQPYYVVSVKPLTGNSCPYSFRYWFRVSDRHIGRQELIHPQAPASKPRNIGPPVVIKDFPVEESAPFLSQNFPTLPISMPLFDTGRRLTPFRAGPRLITQHVQAVQNAQIKEKVHQKLLNKIGTIIPDKTKLFTLTSGANISEQQYWHNDLPWCVYGEKFDGPNPSKRYWLVDNGKD